MKTDTMKTLLCTSIALIFSITIFSQSAQKIHNNAILVDTHNHFLNQTMEKNFVFDTNLIPR